MYNMYDVIYHTLFLVNNCPINLNKLCEQFNLFSSKFNQKKIVLHEMFGSKTHSLRRTIYEICEI